MRKSITTLLVTAALVGSSGAMARDWHGDNNNNGNNNGGQNWSSGGDRGHKSSSGGGGMGGSNGQSQFRVQNGGSGGSRWGNHNFSNVQGGSNVQVQQNWQGSGDKGRNKSWNGNGASWNNNDGGSTRHYRQDQDGGWRNQGDNDQWRKRGGNWNNNGNWNRDWNRGGHHDDWRAWRNSNRDLFRLRPYNGPRGYSYRRFYRGYRLEPFFYAQQYWIDDPWQYRLPPAYGPYRWVRYYNDALLVNIYTGEVEDVIPDFFW